MELSERAQELLDDLLSFTDKDSDELIDEALILLTHHYNGTDPGEQWGSNG